MLTYICKTGMVDGRWNMKTTEICVLLGNI